MYYFFIAETNILLGLDVKLSHGTCVAESLAGNVACDTTFVTDGVFQPPNQSWQQGTLWWTAQSNPVFEIELPMLFEIWSFRIQVDCDDTYYLWYRFVCRPQNAVTKSVVFWPARFIQVVFCERTSTH